jgi:tol-pal system protein YbgF
LAKKICCSILLTFALIASGLAANKEMVQLQADMTLVQDQLRQLKASYDSQNAVIKTLLEQMLDQVAGMRKAIDELKVSNLQSQASVAAKEESINNQISSVNSGLDLVLDKIAKLSSQLGEVRAKQDVEILQDQTGGSALPGIAARPAAPPSPDQLYGAAMGDYNKGNYEMAIQGFIEYLKDYPDTELSDNAAYWVGECNYVQRKFAEAIKAFDKVMSLYPQGDKVPAAMLKKAFSQIELKETAAGIKQLRDVILKYPQSDVAQISKDRLTAMGVPYTAPKAATTKTRK